MVPKEGGDGRVGRIPRCASAGSMRHCKRERDPPGLSRILTTLLLGMRSRRRWALSQSSALEFGVVGAKGSHYCVQVVWSRKSDLVCS